MEELAGAVSRSKWEQASQLSGEKQVIDMILTEDLDHHLEQMLDYEPPVGNIPQPYMTPEEPPHA